MEYTTLKNTDIKVSRLCMGGCPMGGYGWGAVDEGELIASVRAALDCGVNFFDTADTYGLGQSEKTLAKALGSDRSKAVIATKFGVRVENSKTFYDNSPKYIVEALDASLKRLKTDYVDLYQVHYRDGITPLDAVVETLERLKENGKILSYGLSNIHSEDFSEIKPFAGKFVSCQDEFSLACRKNEADLTLLRDELLLTPMTWGSLGQGILTGKYDSSVTFESNDRRSREIYVNFHGEKLKQNLRIVDVLKKVSKNHSKSIPACAIRWILDTMKDSVVIAGIKKPAQLTSNAEATDWHLTENEIQMLNEVSK